MLKLRIKKKCFSLLATFVSLLVQAQTGYFLDFNTGGVPANVTADIAYSLSTVDQQLRISVNKADNWSGITIAFPTALNLSAAANRKVSFRIRTDSSTRRLPFEIRVAFFSGSNQAGGRRTHKVVYPTNKWQTVTFDFNDPGFTSVNWSSVTAVQLVFQPAGYMEGGVVHIDDFAVGNNGVPNQRALAAPYFLGFEDQELFLNTSRTLRIMNAVDADNLNSNVVFSAVSSNPSVLPNPTFLNGTFMSNYYYAFTSGNGSTGDLISSRPVYMVMTPVTNQFGMVTVTVTATSASQIAGVSSVPHHFVFNVDVRRNLPPTIGNLPTSLELGSDRTFRYTMNPVDDGNTESDQNLTITGVSSDQSIIPNNQIIIHHDGKALSANLEITPIPFASLPPKTCSITLTVSDNGGTVSGGQNQTQYTIPVTVYPTYYNRPRFNVIPNQIDNLITQGNRTLTITGITDGNGGSAISSIIARSANTGILSHPTVSYTPGTNFALLTYNSAVVGTTQVSVTATNFGAPGNSNGNSSYTQSFVVSAQNPPLNGYIEPWTVSTVVGPPNADGRFSTVSGTWYVEHQGTIQNFTINTSTQSASLYQNKPGTAPLYFAGVWYKPGGGGNLFNFQQYPYLSVTLSTTNTAGRVAIDLWDVNDIRYGLTSELAVTGTPTTYTFCYNGTPSPGFDFSKVKLVLFNFGVTNYNSGTGNWQPYTGTYQISNLRLGSAAVGAGSCPGNTPSVVIPPLPNPFYLTTQNGFKTLTISGINAGYTPISGQNNNPVSLNVSGSYGASLISHNTATGVAVIGYTTPNTAGTGTINVSGSAVGSVTTNRTITVNIVSPPGSTNTLTINNDLNANMPDGNKGQTMDGGAIGICEIFERAKADFPDAYYERLKELKMESMRIGIYDFEPTNDNDDPNVLDKSKFDRDAMQVEFFRKAHAAGVKRFLVTFFSPPNFVKYNREAGVPAPPQQWIVANTIDSSYYKEYAEYAVAFVKIIKEETGIDIYGISVGNEVQFNQTYQSVVYRTDQYVEILRNIGRRFAQEGIKTFLWGAETLQAQDAGNNYLKACQNDPEVRNYLSGYAIHAYAANGVGQPGPLNWSQILADSRDSRSNGAMNAVRNSPVSPGDAGGGPHNGNGGSGIPVHMTETSGLAGTWDNALGVLSAITTSANAGNVSGWYYIGQNHENKIFYAFKHFSKYLWGGARRLPHTTPSGTSSSAFRNPDGSITLVIANDANATRRISITGSNLPSVWRVFESQANWEWRELSTTSGVITMFPNTMMTVWGGGNALVNATSLVVTAPGNVSRIQTPGGTLQLTAVVTPTNLVDKTVSWSVISVTGNASVDPNGLVMATKNGVVTIRARSNATPSVFGDYTITISGQYVPVTGLTVTGQGGITSITVNGGSLQMVSTISPVEAPIDGVNWSIIPAAGRATISSLGLLTAVSNGLVTVVGTSQDKPSITGICVITITGQTVLVTSATISGAGGIHSINSPSGTLQMIVTHVLPTNATNTVPGWSVHPPFGVAAIGSTGLLTATGNGLVTVTGTFGSVAASRVITISGQFVNIPVTSATISGVPGNQITTPFGAVTMTGVFEPANANTNTLVGWSVSMTSTIAGFNSSTGVLTALNNGNGTVTVTGSYGSVSAIRIVTISGQFVSIPVTSATITGASGVNSITVAGGTLQMQASYSPSNANTHTLIGWSLIDPTGNNTINSSNGLLQANNNGNAIVTVVGTYGNGIVATRIVTIVGQHIPVTSATYTGPNTITVAGGYITLTGIYSPVNANLNTLVGWSIHDPGSIVQFNAATGVIRAIKNGNITVNGMYGSVSIKGFITINNQVTGISILGVNSITSNLGTAQMVALFSPLASSATGVSWHVLGSGATISGTGLLQAIADGIVTVVGSSLLNGSIFATKVVSISNQAASFISVTGLSLTGGNAIHVAGGTLSIGSVVAPANATNPNITWLVHPSSGVVNYATNPTTITLTAAGNGLVTITGVSSNPSVTASKIITVSGYPIPVTQATVIGLGGVQLISTPGGSLQMMALYAPSNANMHTTVGWSAQIPGDIASFNTTNGLLTANNNGNGVVTIIGAFGSVVATRLITIAGQFVAIPVSSVTVSGTGGINAITSPGGNLQMTALYSPANANVNTVIGWTVQIPGGIAFFNPTSGVLTALNNGNGIVTITGSYGSVSASRMVTISGQYVSIPVTAATISGAGNVNVITSPGGSLQIVSVFAPANANTHTVIGWSKMDPGNISYLSSGGLLSAISNGFVTVVGTYSNGVTAQTVVTISGQFVNIPATGFILSVSGGGLSQITNPSSSLSMVPVFTPSNANSNTLVSYTILGNNIASLVPVGNSVTLIPNNNGNGVITVLGTLPGGQVAFREVTISGQNQPATGFSIDGNFGSRVIQVPGGVLPIIATVTPSNSTQVQVVWKLNDPNGISSISGGNSLSTLLQAYNLYNGVVTVSGSLAGTSFVSSVVITISGQRVPLNSIQLSIVSPNTQINTDNGTMQFAAILVPTNTTENTVLYTIVGQNDLGIPNPAGTPLASIGDDGILRAHWNGIVTVMGISYANPSVFDLKVITITNQYINVTSLTGTLPFTVPLNLLGVDDVINTSDIKAYPTFASNKQLELVVISGNDVVSVNGLNIYSLDYRTGSALVKIRSISDTNTFFVLTVNALNVSSGLEIFLTDNEFNILEPSRVLNLGEPYNLFAKLKPKSLPLDEMRSRMRYTVLPTDVGTVDEQGTLMLVGGPSATIIGTYLNNPALRDTLIFATHGVRSDIGHKVPKTPLYVYPNPTFGKFWISDLSSNAVVSLISSNGTRLWTKVSNGVDSYDITEFPSGLYTLEVTENSTKRVIQIIKR